MIMSNNFNLRNYIELLNKKDLDETDQRQLLSYGALVERQISYNRKDEYFSLINDYLSEKINPSIFRGKFLKMQEQDDHKAQIMQEDFEQLSNFSIDSELKGSPFSLFIDLIYDNSMLAIEFGPDDGISESEFKVSIENAFSSLKFFN